MKVAEVLLMGRFVGMLMDKANMQHAVKTLIV